MQSSKLARLKALTSIENVSFLLKYGILVSLLALSYTLRNAPKTTPSNSVSSTNENLVEKLQKNISPFSTDNQDFNNN